MGVAIMISDTRGLWHADMIRSAAARPRGAKSATGVLGLVVDCKQVLSLDSWNTSAWQRQQAPSAVLPLVRESPRTRTTSMQTVFQNIKQWAEAATRIKKKAVPLK